MYERLDNCPLCNSGHFHNKVITKDHSVSGESFAIVECDKCKFNFTNPRPSEEEINSFYESENYISHSNSNRSILDLAYKTVRHFTLKSKVRLINKLSTKKTILDYGCGTGNFLKECQKNGWQITGVEPNQKANEFASKLTGQDIQKDLSSFSDESQFHIITLWHVLEHIHDLNETIQKLRKLLKKKGYLIIALPNHNSWDAEHYGEYWAGYDVPRHLYHFDTDTMKTFANKHNLKIRHIYPQKMDAYYVCLLSEKYINRSNRPLKAIINGNKSNRNAVSNNQYSSLIYILTK